MLTVSTGSPDHFKSHALTQNSVWILLALCLSLRLVLFVVAAPWQQEVLADKILVGDSPAYQRLAERILHGEPLGDTGVRRTPGYPAFLAAIYTIFGIVPWAAILVQIALSGVIIALIYSLTAKWFGKQAAIFASLLYAFEPHAIFSTISILTDTLFTFLLLLSIRIFILGFDSRQLLCVLAVGVLLGLSTLVRPIGLYIPWILVPFLIFNVRPKWKWGLTLCFSMLAAFALTLSPWLLRNHAQYNAFALTDKGGQHLIEWVAPYTEVAVTGKSITDSRAEFKKKAMEAGVKEAKTPFERSRIEQEVAAQYIKQHFIDYVFVSLKGIRNSFINLNTKRMASLLGQDFTELKLDWNDTSSSFFGQLRSFFHTKDRVEILIGGYVALFLMLTYAAAFMGGVAALRQSIIFPVVLTCGMILYFCAFIGPIGVARYKIPFMPFYLALAGNGISYFLSSIRLKLSNS